ncbi:MAG TPA: potassium-transporting ATPase subunit KdpA [Aggregatilineales bacterium]|nr:potassium-transporting ATPase subunit KdpA [Aggregatilineales bacterium]
MTLNGILQILVYIAVLILITKPLGIYMARVYEGKPVILNRVFGPVERAFYSLCGTSETDEMSWQTYALAVLIFNAVGVIFVFVMQRIQASLPLNPQGFPNLTSDLSFNTAASFTTNTNWQAYGGETTMSYLTQMVALVGQNFFSAATGMAMLVALIRGITRHTAQTIGNFWVDMSRSVLYILLPISVVLGLFLVWQGGVQNFSTYQAVNLVQPTSYQTPAVDANGNPVKDAQGNPQMTTVPVTQQFLPMGPVASQIAIKHLGTNGGGFMNANAAHPYESPNPLTDFVLVVSETAIAAAATYMFGKMVGDTRQGWAILAAMMFFFVILLFGAYAAEATPNPKITAMGVDATASQVNPGGNMEGKEVRLGIARSITMGTASTVTSTGAVDSMHDSWMPLGGLVPLFAMHLGETVLGGTGTGLYGMLAFAIVAVFVSGLMVGRTPEYLGKKIEIFDMKMVSIAILIMPAIVLIGMAVAVVANDGGNAGVLNPGPHGFSEIMYAFTSAGNNNGSAFAGITVNTPFYNTALGLVMLFGRYWFALPLLALAGNLARKKFVPPGAGTLPTHTPLFVGMLIGVVFIVGALSFFPVLALGPIVEHLILFS